MSKSIVKNIYVERIADLEMQLEAARTRASIYYNDTKKLREIEFYSNRKLAEAREVISHVVDGSFNQRDVIRFASQCEWYKENVPDPDRDYRHA